MSSKVKTSVALRRAADWLEENPQRHITGVLASDISGREINPIKPEAYCFCGIGRFVHELQEEGEYQACDRRLSQLNKESEYIYSVNDDSAKEAYLVLKAALEPKIITHEEYEAWADDEANQDDWETMHFGLANSEVIQLLRDLAKEAEEIGE